MILFYREGLTPNLYIILFTVAALFIVALIYYRLRPYIAPIPEADELGRPTPYSFDKDHSFGRGIAGVVRFLCVLIGVTLPRMVLL